MAKGNKGPKPKQGFMDKMLHGDEEAQASPQEPSSEEPESDLPFEPSKEKSKKVSAGQGASSDRKHQHRKFDKFK